MFALHFADARSQDSHASTHSANHPKLSAVGLFTYDDGAYCTLFFAKRKHKN